MTDFTGRHLDALALVRWAGVEYGDRLAMTSAFGLNGCALLHLVYEEAHLRPPIYFVNTGYHFPETLATRDALVLRYGLELVEAEAEGDDLPTPDDVEACCRRRKVEPLRRLIDRLQPWALLSSRSRYQAPTRRGLACIEWRSDPLRVNPLAAWSQADVDGYVRAHNIPHSCLYHVGYLSVGCAPCTRAVEDGEDVRAGRWAGMERAECGIWR